MAAPAPAATPHSACTVAKWPGPAETSSRSPGPSRAAVISPTTDACAWDDFQGSSGGRQGACVGSGGVWGGDKGWQGARAAACTAPPVTSSTHQHTLNLTCKPMWNKRIAKPFMARPSRPTPYIPMRRSAPAACRRSTSASAAPSAAATLRCSSATAAASSWGYGLGAVMLTSRCCRLGRWQLGRRRRGGGGTQALACNPSLAADRKSTSVRAIGWLGRWERGRIEEASEPSGAGEA